MAPSHEERMNQLLIQREGFRKELEAFRITLNDYAEGTPTQAIERNLRDIELDFVTFRKYQCELDNRDAGQTQQDRVNLQQLYYAVTGHASVIIDKAANQSEATVRSLATNLSNTSLSDSVDLPKIQLPTFSGAYENWPGFADQFRSAVHDNPRIDDCKRLMYLRSCLTQEAARVISSLSNVASNYATAWEILEQRYNRPAIIVERYLQEMITAASSPRAIQRDLQSYAIKLESHYKALEPLGQPTGDTVLLHLCTANLDRETDLIWREKIKSMPFPTFKEFLKFLNDRCQVLESSRTTRQTRVHAFVTSQPRSLCPICSGPHKIWSCNTFRTKTREERLMAAEEISACTNCLLIGHTLSDCNAGSCRICSQRHHTLLHRPDVQNKERNGSGNWTPPAAPPGVREESVKHPHSHPLPASNPQQQKRQ